MLHDRPADVLEVDVVPVSGGDICPVPRGRAPIPDTSAQAALSAPPRVRLIDLTPYFCNAPRRFSFVGGADVYKDDNHMNAIFAETLGPFLLGT